MFNVQRPTVYYPSIGGGLHSAFRLPESQDFVLGQLDVKEPGPTRVPPNTNYFSIPPRSGGTTPTDGLGGAGPVSPPGLCTICNDRATGKHYGANSCDGCKGFFRRTIRKSQKYSCRFSRNCAIDKDKRNSCRYCRFQKCLAAGMKTEAVQSERDRITSRKRPANEEMKIVTEDQITMLLRAEAVCAQLRDTVIQSPLPRNDPSYMPHDMRLATIADISDSMKQQLLLLVEWAKTLSPFDSLALDDQVSMIRAYAAEHLLIGVARRSLGLNDMLLLSNEAYMTRTLFPQLPDIDLYSHVTKRILDELVEPMRTMNVDDNEYVCLKAIVFFNPNVHGLKNKEPVRLMRESVCMALENYIEEKITAKKGRLSALLLFLPSLQAIGLQMIESLQLASLFGMTQIDNLLQEMLLSESDQTDRITSKAALRFPLMSAQSGSGTDSTITTTLI